MTGGPPPTCRFQASGPNKRDHSNTPFLSPIAELEAATVWKRPSAQPVNPWTSPETDLANVAARAVTEATAAARLATLPDFGTALIERARSELARRAGECW
ncbi:hypothetical protein GCM10010402_67230 [Actinomadura luteofluorescens]